MSVKLMSAIFESEGLGPTERLIMLALADHADEQGRCYPSISRLCKRTGLGERAVQSNIRKLQEAGYLTVHIGAGQNGSNLYFVRSTPAPDAPPAGNAPPQEMHPLPPAPDAPPPHMDPKTPAPDAPKPSRTPIGGGGRARAREAPPDLPGYENPTLRERVLTACGADPVSGLTGPNGRMLGTPADMAEVERWMTDLELHPDQIVGEIERVMAAKRDGPPKSLTYFRDAMRRLSGSLNQPPLTPANVTPLPTGGRHDRKQAAERRDQAFQETLRRVSSGEIDFGPPDDDPFAGG